MKKRPITGSTVTPACVTFNWLRCLLALLLAITGLQAWMPARAADDAAFVSALDSLKSGNFQQKGEAIAKMAQSGDKRVLKIFKALKEGQIFVRRSDKSMVVGIPGDDQYKISDALTGAALGTAGRDDLKRVVINNQLRGTLREAIAQLSLGNDDPSVRLSAVHEMADDMTPEATALLSKAVKTEPDAKVREAMQVALALVAIKDPDKIKRLAAVGVLSGSLLPEARNQLAAMVAKHADGSYGEPDPDVRAAATKALKSIDARVQLLDWVKTIFFGLSLGFVLVLAATGLAITFGVMGVINMAHGEMMMLGAYTTYVVQQLMPNHIDLSVLVAIPAAFLVSGLVGVVIERGVVRFLYGRPLETLLATFGVSLFLQQLVRTIFSPLNRSVSTPSWMSGMLEINSALSVTYNRLYIILFALLVFAGLQLMLKYTPLGLQVRAVSQNRGMAKAMGVRTDWVDAITFGLGSGIAGLAGVALSQLTNVGPDLGQSYIVDCFMVVVFGGVGNLWGTLVAGVSLGVANKFLEPYAGAVLAKILVLVFIILFIQRRPRGLFPQKGRSAEA